MEAQPLVVLVYDLETTGRSTLTDRITQLAMVALDWATGRALDGGINTYVDAGKHISAGATRVTGITDDTIRGAPDEAVMCVMVDNYVARHCSDQLGVLCGHNIVRFDLPLLKNAYERVGRTWLGDTHCPSLLDTLPASRRFWPGLPSYTLGNLFQHTQGQPMQNAHDAMADVAATVLVLRAMWTGRADNLRFEGRPSVPMPCVVPWRWSRADDQALLGAWFDHEGLVATSKHLGRPVASVAARLQAINTQDGQACTEAEGDQGW